MCRNQWQRCLFAGLCFTAVIAALGCGGGSTTQSSTPSTATLVLVQGIASPPVSVTLDGQVLAENLLYLQSTNPLIVGSGNHQLLVQNSSGPLPAGPAGGPLSIDLPAGSRHTLVYYGFGPFESGVADLTDDTSPASGSAKLRIGDFASTVSGVDVYVVTFGTMPSGPPTLTGLGQASHTPTFQVFPPGNYDVFFKANGQILYHTGSIPLAANQNRSLYFLNVCPTTGNSCNLSGEYTAVAVSDLN